MWSTVLHPYDLTRYGKVFAHFDYWQRGLGNNSCQGDVCLPEYECPTSGSYTYTLRFTPDTVNKVHIHPILVRQRLAIILVKLVYFGPPVRLMRTGVFTIKRAVSRYI